MARYRLGNQYPFKVTPTTAKKLLEAIVKSEAQIEYIEQETMMPDFHLDIVFVIEPKRLKKFEEHLGEILEPLS